ncbi:hypothetical protein GBAR_LOCUS14345, partial [Geodia barretti]
MRGVQLTVTSWVVCRLPSEVFVPAIAFTAPGAVPFLWPTTTT